MNVEMQQASNLVISARRALFEKKEIVFTQQGNVSSIHFMFTPRCRLFRPVEALSVSEWFSLCLRRGLRDIKFMVPANTEQKHLLGFANTSQSVIVCFWKKGHVSCFCPVWRYDRKREGWSILYSEHQMDPHTSQKPHFSNQTEDFKKILSEIGQFAADIGFPYFSKVFLNAYDALCDASNIPDSDLPAQLPEGFQAIYYAVEKADVFGAMGSWNDSPPWYAQDKGLGKEYNELSNRLLVQLRHHLMYVANECWTRD